MNRANPRSVADHERYEQAISTEFARDKFWKLRDSLGHEFWSRAQGAIEDNLKNNSNKTGHIAAIAAARKAWRQKHWRDTLKRRRELENLGRALGKVKFDDENKKSSKKKDVEQAFNQVIRVDEFRDHPLRLKKDKSEEFSLHFMGVKGAFSQPYRDLSPIGNVTNRFLWPNGAS